MTVAELINKLQQYPADMPIATKAGENYDYRIDMDATLHYDHWKDEDYVLIGSKMSRMR